MWSPCPNIPIWLMSKLRKKPEGCLPHRPVWGRAAHLLVSQPSLSAGFSEARCLQSRATEPCPIHTAHLPQREVGMTCFLYSSFGLPINFLLGEARGQFFFCAEVEDNCWQGRNCLDGSPPYYPWLFCFLWATIYWQFPTPGSTSPSINSVPTHDFCLKT
jgi:hypothetical protein